MAYRAFERDSSISGTSAVVDNSKSFQEQPSEAGDEKEGHLESYAITLSESTEASLYQAGERAQFSCAVLRAVVSGISRALSGDAVVTAPTVHKDFDWLGRISLKPGQLDGPYYRKHRVYHARGQLLAGGHVLPWQVGRAWRYSDLHALLVDELDELCDIYGLRVHYMELMSTFPPKTWQGRNSNQTSEYRASAIEKYILRGIKITAFLLDSVPAESRLTKRQREREAQRKRQRQRQRQLQRELGGNEENDSEGVAADDGQTDEDDTDVPKEPEQLERELKQILHLFVTRLLGIDSGLLEELLDISQNLGKLISNTPALQTRVTKEFHVDPQQAL